MNIKYNVESLHDCLDEIKVYLEEQHKEMGIFPDKIKLNPLYDKYLMLEDMGVILTITVRDDDNLIGYSLFNVVENLNHMDHIFADNVLLFLDKDYRNSKIGTDLFIFTEELLKEMGVSVINYHTKVKLPFDKLCTNLGYNLLDRTYNKYIGDK